MRPLARWRRSMRSVSGGNRSYYPRKPGSDPIHHEPGSGPMRIITLNVNGLRSAAGKGFLAWMRRQQADVVCLQEIKAHEADLPKRLLAPRGWHAYFHPAQKPGY